MRGAQANPASGCRSASRVAMYTVTSDSTKVFKSSSLKVIDIQRPGRAVAVIPPVFRKLLGLLSDSIRRVEERFRNPNSVQTRIFLCPRERRNQRAEKTSDQSRRRPKSRSHRCPE